MKLAIDNKEKLVLNTGSSVREQSPIRKEILNQSIKAYMQALDIDTIKNINYELKDRDAFNLIINKIVHHIIRTTPTTAQYPSLIRLLRTGASKDDVEINRTILSEKYITMEAPNNIPKHQQELVSDVVTQLAEIGNILTLNIVFKYSADDEVCIIRATEKGNNYIIIGEDINQLSFGFVGKRKGEYNYLHANFINTGIKDIVEAFIA